MPKGTESQDGLYNFFPNMDIILFQCVQNKLKKNIETKMVEKSSYSNYAYSLSHSNEKKGEKWYKCSFTIRKVRGFQLVCFQGFQADFLQSIRPKM